MSDSTEHRPLAARDLGWRCPRCGYNLTGLEPSEAPDDAGPTFRCPECALRIDAVGNYERVDLPTHLDQCDLWQPHQVAIGAARELFVNVMRPGRVLRWINLQGGLASSILMLVAGLLWLWFLAAIPCAAAITIHVGVSPGVAAHAAGLWLVPLLLSAAIPVAACCAAGVAALPFDSSRSAFRLAAYWIPVVVAWSLGLTMALLLVAPELLIGTPALGNLFGVGVSYAASARMLRDQSVVGRRDAFRASHVLAAVVSLIMAATLRPQTLEPPWWVYFVRN